MSERDYLYTEALNVVLNHSIASAPFLQKKLHIGFSMAQELIDRMEREGIVGPSNGPRLRTIDMSKLSIYHGKQSDR